jgi:hypothetical protein
VAKFGEGKIICHVAAKMTCGAGKKRVSMMLRWASSSHIPRRSSSGDSSEMDRSSALVWNRTAAKGRETQWPYGLNPLNTSASMAPTMPSASSTSGTNHQCFETEFAAQYGVDRSPLIQRHYSGDARDRIT